MTHAYPSLDPARDLVAYFCAEFAVDERLPIYSGGLGVLAGDHLKTASDMGLPLIGIGLLYFQGYFTQQLDARGQQQAHAAVYDPAAAGASIVLDTVGRELRVRAPLAEHEVHLRIWRKDVGRVPLFLLDANIPENQPEDRGITARLYDAGADMRIKQEIVLGIGGVRAVRALGLHPTVWHINEGHAAFLILERVRERVSWGHGFDGALECVAASTVFTTHTPVAAGHDVFSRGHLRHWLHEFLGALHTTESRLFTVGANGSGGDRFSMTALALRGSRFRNTVSRIHRGVAARNESYVWPQIPPEENPMGYVTNGVHLPTFLAEPWQQQLDRQVPDWRGRPLRAEEMSFVDQMADSELRELRQGLRARLLSELRRRLEETHRRLGTPAAVLEPLLSGLERGRAGAPLLGFARRFATYKRATLLLSDADRLARLLGHPERPALLLFAGKAHPHDSGGQGLLRQLYETSLQPRFLGRLLVLEGYDLVLARLLVQGCDIWLNTPEYPLEASGTSGMKAGANGVINVSIADGWWGEGYDGANGFSLDPVAGADAVQRDASEARQLFELLERRVLPEYYGASASASAQGLAPEWLHRLRHSVRTIIPRFGSTRMLDEYRRHYYAVAAAHGAKLELRSSKAAVNLARWKKLVQLRWGGVKLKLEQGQPLRVSVDTHGIPASCLVVEGLPAEGAPLRFHLESGDHHHGHYLPDGPVPAGGLQRLRLYPSHALLPHRFEAGLLLEFELGAR